MEILDYKDKHEYKNKHGVTSIVYLMDCMDLLKQIPDKYFELAIVDPPYGIGFGTFNRTNKTDTGVSVKANKYKNGEWDKCIPMEEYFNYLFTATQNQIIWGWNYFPLPPTQCFIFWYKHQPVSNFADGEYAWCSFKKPAQCFDYAYYGGIQGNTKADTKIHPTQKPQQLYEWLIKNYAKEGDKILDTHLGSGSSRIAADKANLPFVGCELDEDYFYASVKRFNEYSSQQTMF